MKRLQTDIFKCLSTSHSALFSNKWLKKSAYTPYLIKLLFGNRLQKEYVTNIKAIMGREP